MKLSLKDLLSDISDKEYNEMLLFMEANHNIDDSPKVGIFYYNTIQKKLFGVIKHSLDDYDKPNYGENKISCLESLNSEYQTELNGRIYYNIDAETFEVHVGEWINEYPEAIDKITQEFNLSEGEYMICKTLKSI